MARDSSRSAPLQPLITIQRQLSDLREPHIPDVAPPCSIIVCFAGALTCTPSLVISFSSRMALRDYEPSERSASAVLGRRLVGFRRADAEPQYFSDQITDVSVQVSPSYRCWIDSTTPVTTRAKINIFPRAGYCCLGSNPSNRDNTLGIGDNKARRSLPAGREPEEWIPPMHSHTSPGQAI